MQRCQNRKLEQLESLFRRRLASCRVSRLGFTLSLGHECTSAGLNIRRGLGKCQLDAGQILSATRLGEGGLYEG